MHPRVNVCAIIYVIDIYQIIVFIFATKVRTRRETTKFMTRSKRLCLITVISDSEKLDPREKTTVYEMNYY